MGNHRPEIFRITLLLASMLTFSTEFRSILLRCDSKSLFWIILKKKWWATLESNQACVSARELQSPQVRGISTKQGANASMVQGVPAAIRCVYRNLQSIRRCLRGLLPFCHPLRENRGRTPPRLPTQDI